MNNNSDYFCWLLDRIGVLTGDKQDYILLCQHLFSVDYFWVFDLDSNREAAGKNLRKEFADETMIYEDEVMSISEPCKVLEMLIGLAHKIQELYEGSEESWFWEMMENIGLSEFDDRNYDAKYVDQIISEWLNYSKGSLFPPYTNTSIWDQMNKYMHDKYPVTF